MPPDLPPSRIINGQVAVGEILTYLYNDRWFSKTSASQYADLGIKRIEEAIRHGQLRAYTVGRKILIKKSDIDHWIEAGEVTRAAVEIQKTGLQDLADKAIKEARARLSRRDP